MRFDIELPQDPIVPRSGAKDSANGAELIFHGRVRGLEGDVPIKGLEYEAYGPLAEKRLRELAEEAVRRFQLGSFTCRHRLGFVPVGEISLEVIIRSPHRQAALEAMAWFIDALKKDVPIWKWVHPTQGTKYPA